jgi:hypothetical protein
MDVDVRPHLYLFDFYGLLLLARLGRLLLGLVFVAAVVEDLGDRRDRIGGDLDEVEARLARQFERTRDRRGAMIGAAGVDQLNLGNPDFLVDARSVLGGRRRLEGSANGGDLLCRFIVPSGESRRNVKKSAKGPVKSTADGPRLSSFPGFRHNR